MMSMMSVMMIYIHNGNVHDDDFQDLNEDDVHDIHDDDIHTVNDYDGQGCP